MHLATPLGALSVRRRSNKLFSVCDLSLFLSLLYTPITSYTRSICFCESLNSRPHLLRLPHVVPCPIWRCTETVEISSYLTTCTAARCTHDANASSVWVHHIVFELAWEFPAYSLQAKGFPRQMFQEMFEHHTIFFADHVCRKGFTSLGTTAYAGATKLLDSFQACTCLNV